MIPLGMAAMDRGGGDCAVYQRAPLGAIASSDRDKDVGHPRVRRHRRMKATTSSVALAWQSHLAGQRRRRQQPVSANVLLVRDNADAGDGGGEGRRRLGSADVTTETTATAVMAAGGGVRRRSIVCWARSGATFIFYMAHKIEWQQGSPQRGGVF